MRTKASILTALSFTVSIICHGQQKKSKWTNKDKGSYVVAPHRLGIVADTTICAISVKIYELSEYGCTIITTGQVRVNGKEYPFYDKTDTPDTNKLKDPTNFFYRELPNGIYNIKISVNKDYYPVKTDNFFLRAKNIYQFTFYVVRKDALKKG